MFPYLSQYVFHFQSFEIYWDFYLMILKLGNFGKYSMGNGKEHVFYVKVTAVNTSLNPMLFWWLEGSRRDAPLLGLAQEHPDTEQAGEPAGRGATWGQSSHPPDREGKPSDPPGLHPVHQLTMCAPASPAWVGWVQGRLRFTEHLVVSVSTRFGVVCYTAGDSWHTAADRLPITALWELSPWTPGNVINQQRKWDFEWNTLSVQPDLFLCFSFLGGLWSS